jgi:hypothetical protein
MSGTHETSCRRFLAKLKVTAVVLAVATWFTACQPLLDVSLASQQESLPSPAFEVKDPGSAHARFNTVEVMEKSGKVVWRVRSEPLSAQTDIARVTYGQQPAGLITLVPPVALERGGEYTIHVLGLAKGALRFRIDGAGRVHPL